MNHWELIREQADRKKDKAFTSLVLQHEYKITEVSDRRIVIDRITVGGPAPFGRAAVNTASERVRIEKRVRKARGASGAVRQCALVYLHPCIEWDSVSKELFWVDKAMPSLSSAKSFIDQANDDDLDKIQTWINLRRNQDDFRKAIMRIYENKCAITGTSRKEVLEAAHIFEHAKRGINSNENGLLLRADIHRLFDRRLLLIHPKTLVIYLHKSLLHGEYGNYNGKRMRMPIDGSRPNQKYLEMRWSNRKDHP